MNRVLYLDIIRIASIIGVVCMHVSHRLVRNNNLDLLSWWFANFLDSLSRCSVPLFVMISGALLLGRKNIYISDFYKKRLSKVLIPLVLWSLVYYLYRFYFFDNPFTLKDFIVKLLNGKILNRYWFIYMIAGLYLAVPFLNSIINEMPRKCIYYFMFFWFFLVGINRLIFFLFEFNIAIPIYLFTDYIGYFFLGFFLHKNKLNMRFASAIAMPLFFLCFSITMIGTFFYRELYGEYEPFFYNFLSPNVMLMSIAVFIIIKDLSADKLHNSIILEKVSEATLGIYLIHTIIQQSLASGYFGFKLDGWFINPFLGIPLSLLAVYCLSLFSVLVIKKVPILSHLAP